MIGSGDGLHRRCPHGPQLPPLTLLPAMLGFAGNAIDKLHLPRLLQTGGPPPENGFWYRWSRFVQRRAWVTGIVAVLILVALALPLFSMRLAFTDAGNDPTSLTTRQAYDLLAQGFGPGFNGPLVIAADMQGSATDSAAQCSRSHGNGRLTSSSTSPPTTMASAFVTAAGSSTQAHTRRGHRRVPRRRHHSRPRPRRSSRPSATATSYPPSSAGTSMSTRRSAARRPKPVQDVPPTSSGTGSSS